MLKNVTGLDLCKLLAGSHGTLGVITEVTLKVLPAAAGDRHRGGAGRRTSRPAVRVLSAGLGSPYGVSGAAVLPGEHGRWRSCGWRNSPESVAYRAGRLREALAGIGEVSVIEDAESRALWRRVRDAEPLDAAPEEAIWRVSVQPTAGPGVVAALRLRARRCWTGAAGWSGWPARRPPRRMPR